MENVDWYRRRFDQKTVPTTVQVNDTAAEAGVFLKFKVIRSTLEPSALAVLSEERSPRVYRVHFFSQSYGLPC